MWSAEYSRTLSYVVLLGSVATSLFLVTNQVSDPVNAPKFLFAGGFAFALLALIASKFNELWSLHRTFTILSFLFILSMVNSVLNSDSPLVQNLYGSYGRNTGFLAYFFLTLISLGSLFLSEHHSFNKLMYGLVFVGIVNVIYCAWVIMFGDFLGWNNPYGNILGLFGNPNFISAFLGIFINVVLALALGKGRSLVYRLVSALVALVAFYEIVDSSAVQGLVVTAGGLAMIGFFVIRSKIKSTILIFSYVAAVLLLGVTSILGALQRGPFDFIYKTSVSLRGEYWQAGIEMGKTHLFSGVGMDAYGDWYRRARSIEAATVMPGPNTVTNAAHNVVIDIFAYGGLPLLICYVGMLLITLVSASRIIKKSKSYDPVFVAMFVAWTCYQVQSLISINQIGLALWGWVLTGALIAYERFSRQQEMNTKSVEPTTFGRKRAQARTSGVLPPQLIATFGALVGIFIASPPIAADITWRSALNSQNVTQVMNALDPSFMNPSNSFKFVDAAKAFANSNFPIQAREVVLKATEFNPDNFDAWRVLYFLQNSTELEKELALANMKRLDPNNPDVTKA